MFLLHKETTFVGMIRLLVDVISRITVCSLLCMYHCQVFRASYFLNRCCSNCMNFIIKMVVVLVSLIVMAQCLPLFLMR
jgi:hypothetical protein